MSAIASLLLRLPCDTVERLLRDRWAAARWTAGRIDAVPGGACLMTDRAGLEWTGHVVAFGPGEPVVLKLAGPAGLEVPVLAYRIEVRAEGGHSGRTSGACIVDVIAVRETSPPPAAVRLWEVVLRRLEQMVTEIRQRREPRQAVVVIHGIGEQRPGRTLESFVAAVTDDLAVPVWSGADRASGSRELRQLTVPATRDRPRTTFYEYYWAHQVHDTTAGDVLGWLWSIMGRLPWTIPSRLRAAWLLLWALALAAGATAVAFGSGLDDLQWLSTVTTAVLGLLASVFVRFLGDAARYLSPRPRNIAIRERIRRGGIDLVRDLHSTGQFHRIVLVGHSLGSVVAHDIVTHLWVELHRDHLRPEQVSFSAVQSAHDAGDTKLARSAQAAVWREMRRNTQPWLVTDLITLGSPLAHADLLVTKTRAELDERRQRGELATAPPPRNSRGGRFSHNRSYWTRSSGQRRSFTVLDESAVFAAVRWTNLYFPAPGGVFGDVVGGPIAPLFGNWVLDHPVRSRFGVLRRRSLLAHTAYWRPSPSAWNGAAPGRGARDDSGSWTDRLAASTDHLETLRLALDLDRRQELAEAAERHDPLLYLRTLV